MPDTITQTPDAALKARILYALGQLARSRPGLNPCDYIARPGDSEGLRAYRAEVRSVGRDLRDARELLRAVERAGLTGEDLAHALAGEGRLSWRGDALEYCPGQYYATEYRAAVCRVAASALWSWYAGPTLGQPGTADRVARTLVNVLGRRLATRWGR